MKYLGGFVPPPMPAHPKPMPWQASDGDDSERQGIIKQDSCFSDKSIRAGFILKVSTLVTIILAAVTGMVALAMLYPPTNYFAKSSPNRNGASL
uniref:Uncharacterized protein n=1 Tax=Plectus sambesii TaxID=2011161 RepID=A0A914W6J1_9BILA